MKLRQPAAPAYPGPRKATPAIEIAIAISEWKVHALRSQDQELEGSLGLTLRKSVTVNG
jgi:hypothetical protein